MQSCNAGGIFQCHLSISQLLMKLAKLMPIILLTWHIYYHLLSLYCVWKTAYLGSWLCFCHQVILLDEINLHVYFFYLTDWTYPSCCQKKWSYPGWQWAAVMTYREVMRTPPHLFLVNNPSHVDSRTSTCHGHSPNVAPFPPTIRPVFCMRGLTPHSRVQQILDMNRLHSLQKPLLLYRIEVKCKHMQI